MQERCHLVALHEYAQLLGQRRGPSLEETSHGHALQRGRGRGVLVQILGRCNCRSETAPRLPSRLELCTCEVCMWWRGGGRPWYPWPAYLVHGRSNLKNGDHRGHVHQLDCVLQRNACMAWCSAALTPVTCVCAPSRGCWLPVAWSWRRRATSRRALHVHRLVSRGRPGGGRRTKAAAAAAAEGPQQVGVLGRVSRHHIPVGGHLRQGARPRRRVTAAGLRRAARGRLGAPLRAMGRQPVSSVSSKRRSADAAGAHQLHAQQLVAGQAVLSCHEAFAAARDVPAHAHTRA